ncbi:hypothetical protein [Pedobacter sp. JCM 36344]|uniref:hypothetical protein n=1 Tax=Pedobacter sp. JCM 36344 TaxID=3374280 RepID=UPI00397E9020
MKLSKLLVSLILFVGCNISISHSQIKKDTVYYLADTAGVSSSNQILKIGQELKNSYGFYCKCIPPYDAYLIYIYRDKPKPLAFLPKFRYLAWYELQDIAYESGAKFNDRYVFYIIEKLPKGYQIAQVEQRIIKLPGTTN